MAERGLAGESTDMLLANIALVRNLGRGAGRVAMIVPPHMIAPDDLAAAIKRGQELRRGARLVTGSKDRGECAARPALTPDDSGMPAKPLRDQAFDAWCECVGYTNERDDSPHVEAFFAGYDAAIQDVVPAACVCGRDLPCVCPGTADASRIVPEDSMRFGSNKGFEL